MALKHDNSPTKACDKREREKRRLFARATRGASFSYRINAQQLVYKKTVSFVSFPYVCPEPVLVKRSLLN